MTLEPRSSRTYYLHDDTILSANYHYEREQSPDPAPPEFVQMVRRIEGPAGQMGQHPLNRFGQPFRGGRSGCHNSLTFQLPASIYMVEGQVNRRKIAPAYVAVPGRAFAAIIMWLGDDMHSGWGAT